MKKNKNKELNQKKIVKKYCSPVIKTTRFEFPVYGGTGACSSDKKLKKNIKNSENSLEKILKMQGVTFEWNDSQRGEGRQIGLVAQDVQRVFPELVSQDKWGFLQVDYAKLTAILIEAIKEQQLEINRIKNKLSL